MNTIGFISTAFYVYVTRGEKPEDKSYLIDLMKTMIDWNEKNNETTENEYLKRTMEKL